MPLSAEPEQPLTSREMARLLSGLLSSCALNAEVDDIWEALEHFQRHKDTYTREWIKVREHHALIQFSHEVSQNG